MSELNRIESQLEHWRGKAFEASQEVHRLEVELALAMARAPENTLEKRISDLITEWERRLKNWTSAMERFPQASLQVEKYSDRLEELKRAVNNEPAKEDER